ncbi:hypothetical protein R3Q06_31175 [Rhodococcus erythropolis]|nr:hypothetical protein [Rhodococcus erythropolis]MDV6277949.1 hypothetical protein [Rhodococcus erythropolis]
MTPTELKYKWHDTDSQFVDATDAGYAGYAAQAAQAAKAAKENAA